MERTSPSGAQTATPDSYTARLLDTISTPVAYLDADFVYRYLNSAAEQAFGLSASEVIGQRMGDVAVERSDVTDVVKKAARTRRETTAVVKWAASGSSSSAHHHYAVTCTPDLDDRGRLSGLVLEGFDVSEHVSALLEAQADLRTEVAEHRKTECELQESTMLFGITFEHAAVGIVLADMAGRVLQANPKFEEMLGYERHHTTGLPINDFATLEDTIDDSALLRDLLEGRRESYEIEKHYVRRSGSVFIGSMTVSIVRGDDGTPLMTIGVLEDVTEKRRVEQLQRDLNLRIRAAYSDVIDAATGGRLVLLTLEELRGVLGTSLEQAERIGDAQSLGDARRDIKEKLERLECKPRDLDAFVLAASEAITNAVKHAGGGQYAVREHDGAAQVVVADWGGGIDFRTLPKATLVAGFSTAQSLGMGYTIMLDVCDRVLLATEPGMTAVVLEMNAGEEHAAPALGLDADEALAAWPDSRPLRQDPPVLDEMADRLDGKIKRNHTS